MSEQMEQLRAAYNAGLYPEALAVYQRGGADEAEWHTYGAAAMLDTGDLDGALLASQLAVGLPAEWPLRGSALFVAARVAMSRGDFHGATAHLKTAIAAGEVAGETHMPKVWTTLALARRLAGDYEQAVFYGDLAAEQFAKDKNTAGQCVALQNLAWAACRAGKGDAARQALDKAEPLCTTPLLRWHQQIGEAYVLALRNSLAAIECCRDLLAAEGAPANVQTQAAWLAGRMHLDMGRLDEARAMAEQAADLAVLTGRPGFYRQDIETLQRLIDAEAAV